MQTQDVPGEFMFRIWPWLEANKVRLIGGAAAVLVVAGVVFIVSTHKQQREVEAGQAVSALLINPANAGNTAQLAAGLEKLADQYAGTAAGARAGLQAAAALFDAGNYKEAQAQFEKYLNTNPSGTFASTAQLGLAASFQAQTNLDAAGTAYQRVISMYPGSPAVAQAEFALGAIAQQQNKLSEAMSHFENAARAAMGGSLANEAMTRAAELREKLAASAPKPAARTATPMVITPTATPPAASKPAAPAQNPVKP